MRLEDVLLITWGCRDHLGGMDTPQLFQEAFGFSLPYVDARDGWPYSKADQKHKTAFTSDTVYQARLGETADWYADIIIEYCERHSLLSAVL